MRPLSRVLVGSVTVLQTLACGSGGEGAAPAVTAAGGSSSAGAGGGQAGGTGGAAAGTSGASGSTQAGGKAGAGTGGSAGATTGGTAGSATGGAAGATTGGAAGATTGGAAGAGGTPVLCPTPPIADPMKAARSACMFDAGAKVKDTLGIDDATRKAIPIKHLVIVMNENRSFDHMLGKLSTSGQPDAEAVPSTFTNPDATGAKVSAHHLTSTCIEADPPHQGAAMHAMWDNGKLDGFVKNADVGGSDGHYVMGYYDETDLPFYYFLGKTFAIGDRYFAPTLAGTWANRDYLYAGTSDGVTDTGSTAITVPTIYDALDKAKVSWGVYSDGAPRQNSIGWTSSHKGFSDFKAFLAALDDGSLPSVVFVDPGGPGQDEHPTANVQPGEGWAHTIYDHALKSPLWPSLAVIYTYDEAGGLADHVPPPKACLASPDQTAFDRLGFRVPMYVISPWARKSFVSHEVHEHSSTLRLIELLHDLPALTGRDANSDALLDLFDFACDAMKVPPTAPAAGKGGC